MKLPNGFSSVHKLSGKRRKPYIAQKTIGWEIIDETTGKKRQLYQTVGYFETRAAALIALSEFNANPYDIDASKVTFAELFDKLTSTKSYEELSRSSKHARNVAYARCKNIWNIPYVKIKKSHLQNCIDDIDDAGWGTTKKVKTLFNQIFAIAYECDVAEKNYAEFVDIGKNDSSGCHIPFTKEEKQLVWNHINDIEYLDTILILLYTGMRVGVC